MRFLGIGDDASLGDMYLQLAAAGHEVRIHQADPAAADVMAGLLTRVEDWQRELGWVREAGADGILIFENAHMGEIQDELRRRGFNVIGGSAFGDRLEQDRAFGQDCLRQVGCKTAPTRAFTDFAAAIDYVRSRPRRYVFKLNGSGNAPSRNHVGELDDGADILALLERLQSMWTDEARPDFVLMDHVDGVEVGVGAYFNGERFMEPVVIDFEHKRFFDGDLGELTGEMGTLISYRNSGNLFSRTLAHMAEALRDGGYVGYINLNTIVNADGIWPLEFTARFGYPGFAICDALHEEGWDALFARMIARGRLDFRTRPGFAIGLALTVPPFPNGDRYAQLSKGMPILFRGELSARDRRHLHLSEVELRDGRLLTSGEIGYLMVVTGCGETVEQARAEAYGLARRVVVPNLRYRTDIGRRFIDREQAMLRQWGLWPA